VQLQHTIDSRKIEQFQIFLRIFACSYFWEYPRANSICLLLLQRKTIGGRAIILRKILLKIHSLTSHILSNSPLLLFTFLPLTVLVIWSYTLRQGLTGEREAVLNIKYSRLRLSVLTYPFGSYRLFLLNAEKLRLAYAACRSRSCCLSNYDQFTSSQNRRFVISDHVIQKMAYFLN